MPCAPTVENRMSWTEGLQRPRYYPRQLVTPAELNLESRYFVERLRRHNRMLHGWGVVCGARSVPCPSENGTGKQPWKLKLCPGYAIDGHGNDVVIDAERIVDIRSSSVLIPSGAPEGELRDPWCSDVWGDREGGTVWVAICHEERPARPVRPQPTGCGCDDPSCEYSRWHDGYRVTFLDHCPDSHSGPAPTTEDFLASLSGGLRECPECPEDPCVVLAAVTYEADGTVTGVDNCSCRRNVVSLADLWWRCASAGVTVGGVEAAPTGPYTPGTTGITLTVTGENIHEDATVDLGPGISVVSKDVPTGGESMTLEVTVEQEAEPGERTLTIENPDCSVAAHPDAITVVAAKPTRRRRKQ